MKVTHYGSSGDELVVSEMPDDGTLTPEARNVFSNGHCHSFALALSQLTGWPVVGLIAPDGRTVGHVLCLKPDGMLVDIREEYRGGNNPAMLRSMAGCKWRGKGWLKPDVAAALPFAQARLREMGVQTGPPG
jgi:hypothetical protein